jgi:hypothetical protein
MFQGEVQMFDQLIARIFHTGFGPIRVWGGAGERSDTLAEEPTFEIFRRLRQGPVLVERVSGIVEACDRMKQIAKEKPGVRYFAAEAKTGSVVAEIDATIRVKRRRLIVG